MQLSEKYVIFGAGKYGRLALDEYEGEVAYYIDSNPEKWDTYLEGIVIKSLSYFLENDKDRYVVLIASKQRNEMERTLVDAGIKKYKYFLDFDKVYAPTNRLIYNPYKRGVDRGLTEELWNEFQNNNELARKKIYDELSRIKSIDKYLFDHVEIETINRCNGGCDFCPVSKKNESREFKVMEWELFKNIIDQLAEIGYSGRLALFSNNEPFLDEGILEKHEYARTNLPNCRMHLFTNGTLLTIDKFLKLIEYLDELVIDNYNQELKLIKPCQEIFEYCKENDDIRKKVTIVLRKPHEILTSRGGDAPNRGNIVSYPDLPCVLPFKQLIIRPDGKVSLCCNDPLGRDTLGDVKKDKLVDIWYGERFSLVREKLGSGRGNWNHCVNCDNFSIG